MSLPQKRHGPPRPLSNFWSAELNNDPSEWLVSKSTFSTTRVVQELNTDGCFIIIIFYSIYLSCILKEGSNSRAKTSMCVKLKKSQWF